MTQPQEVLRVTEDGQFIWHPEADVMLKEGNFSHAPAMQHMLIALRKQRQWVGLTDEELQFYRKKYSKLFNAGYDKMTDTNLIAETFDSAGFYKEVEAVLKERNT